MNNEQIILYLKEFVTEKRFALFQKIVEWRTHYVSVLLENIYQSHNASAIVRTCEAHGLQDVYIYERNNKFVTNEEISMGADKWLSIHRYNEKEISIPVLFDNIHQNGYSIVATTLHKTAVSLYDLPVDKSKLMFLFGTEKEGLSKEMIQHADEYVKIPMYGFTESFNVSVSAGIVLNYIVQKIRNSSLSVSLPQEEKERLLIEWLVRSIPSGKKILKDLIISDNKIQM